MKTEKQVTFLIFLFIILSNLLVNVIAVDEQVETESTPHDLIISGWVDHSVNLSYSELQSFPMVSEVAVMRCVAGWTQLYNWTGIPLLFLLSKTGVKVGATEVVFYASDSFSSSLTIERALHPTTLLAVQANGTVLSYDNGYPYRLVVPCKYGYKWVKWITRVEVIGYDYKGTYESMGYSDEANIPECTIPSTTPFEVFHFNLGSTTYNIITLSNSTINSFNFDTLQKQLYFNVTGPPITTGYCYVTIPKELLLFSNLEQWQVWVNNAPTEDRKDMKFTNYTYMYFTYNHSTLDTTPPTLSSLSPENKTYTVNEVLLTFTFDETTSWIGYSLDGQANVTITGNTTLSGLSDGSHSLVVYAQDTAGNTGASNAIYFSIIAQREELQQVEPFPTWIVAAPVIIAAFGTLLYILKIKKKS